MADGVERGTLLSASQAAERIGCSPRTVQRWVSIGALRHVRIGRLVRIDAADLAAWIEQSKHGGNVVQLRGRS